MFVLVIPNSSTFMMKIHPYNSSIYGWIILCKGLLTQWTKKFPLVIKSTLVWIKLNDEWTFLRGWNWMPTPVIFAMWVVMNSNVNGWTLTTWMKSSFENKIIHKSKTNACLCVWLVGKEGKKLVCKLWMMFYTNLALQYWFPNFKIWMRILHMNM